MKRLLSALLVALLPAVAMAQQTVQQGGSFAAGRVPTYSGSSGAPIVQSAGSAGGGGVGIAELPVIARGTGLPPFVGQGSGPLGSIFTIYDGPTNSAAGYHYLGLSANSQGGGLLTYGAGGGAAQLPLSFVVNGVAYPFPFGGGGGGGGIVGPGTTISGDMVCWNNNVGTLVSDCRGTVQFSGATSGATTLSVPAVASGIWTLPNATDTLVGKATTDTLTNKTLTSPTISTPAITGGTITSSTIASPSISSPTISNATINIATITQGSMGSLSTAATQAASDNSTKLATTAYVDSAIGVGMPIGSCVAYGGASAPTNWALAFGQAVSRTTFATLFSAYGITYGAGDGTTTFNMPDLRGRAVFGADAMGGTPASRLGSGATGGITGAATVAATGGQQSHVQTSGELATHTHSTAISSGVSILTNINTGAGIATAVAGADIPIFNAGNGLTNTGSSIAANITPPALVMNYICKTN